MNKLQIYFINSILSKCSFAQKIKTVRKASFFVLLLCILYSCNNTNKSIDKINTNKSKNKDSINVLEIIKQNDPPHKCAAGGGCVEILGRSIVQYNNLQNDTVVADIKVTQITHRGAIPYPEGTQPPKETPTEHIEKYKFYQQNGKWKQQIIDQH